LGLLESAKTLGGKKMPEKKDWMIRIGKGYISSCVLFAPRTAYSWNRMGNLTEMPADCGPKEKKKHKKISLTDSIPDISIR
jgi:hypothetical protein